MSPYIQELARKLSNDPDRILPPEAYQVSEKGAQYLAGIWQERPTASAPTVKMRSFEQVCDYSEIWKPFAMHMKQREIEISAQRGEAFTWEFSADMKRKIADILRYFVNDRKSEIPLYKGLLIYGQPGTGKTEIMQAVQVAAKAVNSPKVFEWTNLSEEYTKAKANQNYDPIEKNVMFDRCFDEFLRQFGPVNPRGLDITEAAIEQREARFKRYGQLTHIVSNLDTVEMADILSKMAFDRIRSMCTSIEFDGESKRA